MALLRRAESIKTMPVIAKLKSKQAVSKLLRIASRLFDFRVGFCRHFSLPCRSIISRQKEAACDKATF